MSPSALTLMWASGAEAKKNMTNQRGCRLVDVGGDLGAYLISAGVVNGYNPSIDPRQARMKTEVVTLIKWSGPEIPHS